MTLPDRAMRRPLGASCAVVTAAAVAYTGPGSAAIAPFRPRIFGLR
jgi:hypothetical protein